MWVHVCDNNPNLCNVSNTWVFASISEKTADEPLSEMKKMIKWPDLTAPKVDSNSPHAVCGSGSSFGRSSLHKAVCEMDLATIQREVSVAANNNDNILLRQDEAGYCPLHSACALRMLKVNNYTIACEIVRTLLAAGADSSCTDNNGNTPLHWAARAGDKDVAEVLLLKNCPQGTHSAVQSFPC